MKKFRIVLVMIFLGLTLTLSACVPGPRVTGTPGISLSEDEVYVSYANFVYEIDAKTGGVNWSFPEERDAQVIFYAEPLVTEDFIYVGDLANKFHKIDRKTGEDVWTFSGAKGYFIGKAAEDNGTVYAPSNDGILYALDPDGDLLWKFKTGHYLWSQPLISGKTIYLPSMDHSVYALSSSGTELWSTEMLGGIVGTPVLNESGDILFVGTLGKEVAALDVKTGAILWTYQTEASVWGSPLLEAGILYFADSGGNIYALDPTDQSMVWQTEYAGSVVSSLTAIEDGFVVATEEGVIKAFDFDGTPRWESTLDGKIYQAPAVNENYLVAGTINGEKLIYGFNPKGVQLWSITPEN